MVARLDLTVVRVIHNGRTFLVRFKDGEWYDIKERLLVDVTRRTTATPRKKLGRFLYKTVVDQAKEQIDG